jgi:hypothetical protein
MPQLLHPWRKNSTITHWRSDWVGSQLVWMLQRSENLHPYQESKPNSLIIQYAA